ncbi:hypothetical protein WAZ07_18290 [Bacillus sp. FJAT-51639]|uniref:Uncharacterized protein n=1 Tax=Bacillus bruguierae TaxID=3127667 RepID=A0ABU8FKJ7_9BACI
MLLGTYTLYMGKQYKVLNYDKESKNVKLQLDDKINYKIVKRDAVEEIYSIQTDCFYKGYKFQVISEKEDSILIYTPNYEVGAELNMEFIERSVFHKWIKKNEVDRIVEEKMVLDL